jgi:hypothetical protein
LADLAPSGFDIAGVGFSDHALELGEDLVDGIEVGAVKSRHALENLERPDAGRSRRDKRALAGRSGVQVYDTAKKAKLAKNPVSNLLHEPLTL